LGSKEHQISHNGIITSGMRFLPKDSHFRRMTSGYSTLVDFLGLL